MFVEERLKNIVSHVRKHGRATVSELERLFKVSAVTIRRDLEFLEERHSLKRTHGGAITDISSAEEFSYDEKRALNESLKQRIGKSAVPLARGCVTIIIDSGTTTFQVAKFIAPQSGFKIITNSLPVAELMHDSANEVILLGGELRKKSMSLVGSYTEKAVDSMNADICFVGASGMASDGSMYSASEIEAATKRALLSHSTKKVIVADRTKADSRSFARFAGIKDWDMLVTNRDIDEGFLKKIKAQMKRVVLA